MKRTLWQEVKLFYQFVTGRHPLYTEKREVKM
jgi:hypothetical protein